MARTTTLFVLVQCALAVSSALCSTLRRLEADTVACGWSFPTTAYTAGYTRMEFKLRQANMPVGDLDALYQMVAEEEIEARNEPGVKFNSIMIQSLEQFRLTKDLERRDCYDQCAHVLAKINCNSATPLYACQPLNQQRNYVKTMLEAKVFPLIERCQIPLVYQTLMVNMTIDPDLYMTVDHIAYRMMDMTVFSSFYTIGDLVLRHSKPFFAIRRIVRPIQSGFYEDLGEIMLYLDIQRGSEELFTAIQSGQITPDQARDFYEQIILLPCLRFIDQLHTAMDPTIFYGRLIDLKRSAFEIEDIYPDIKLEFFKLLLLYESCAHLDDQNEIVNHRKLARDLLKVDIS